MEEQCTQKDAHVNALTRQRMELSTNLTELGIECFAHVDIGFVDWVEIDQ